MAGAPEKLIEPSSHPFQRTRADRRDLFVGRDRELNQLEARVRESSLVTLRGPIGIGKSRLLSRFLETAAPTGVAVALSINPRNRTLPTAHITGAFGLPVAERSLPLEDLGRFLVELSPQVIAVDEAPRDAMIRLLAGISDVPILSTRRDEYDLANETIVDVPPLSAEEAAALFLARSRASVSDAFPVGPEMVASWVHQLGRNPLALELAAPWVAEAATIQAGLAASSNDSITGLLSAIWDALGASEREVLTYASFARGLFDASPRSDLSQAALTRIMTLDAGQIDTALSVLLRRGLLRHAPGKDDRFVVPKWVRKYVRRVSELPFEARRRIQRRITSESRGSSLRRPSSPPQLRS